MADFFKAAVVASIDATAYHGAIGDVIDVVAIDDFEVAGVTVSIRDGANVVIEEGAAMLAEGKWRYTATTAIAAGTAIAIEATAFDRPGNPGMRSLVLNVA